MPTNVNAAGAPSIQPASRTSETRTDRIAVSRDGGSGSGFAKQTDVKFTNSVDNMSAVLEKVSAGKLGADAALPEQLKEMINNVVKNAFSLDSSLGEGLGSAMASERYSIEQLTTLSRIFQQLGNFADAHSVTAEQLTGEQQAGELSDELQVLMANIKNIIGEAGLVSKSSSLELVQLNKLAFQLLNDGSSEKLPEDFVQLLQFLVGQGTAGQGAAQGNEPLTALKQLIDVLFPKPLAADNAGQPVQSTVGGQQAGQSGAQAAGSQAGAAQAPQAPGDTAQGAAAAGNRVNIPRAANGSNGAAANTGGNGMIQTGAPAAQGQPAVNMAAAAAGNGMGQEVTENKAAVPDSQMTGAQVQKGQTAGGASSPSGAEQLRGQSDGSGAVSADGQNQTGKNVQSNTAQPDQGGRTLMNHARELENNPLFRQIFSRYGYSQETGVVRPAPQQAVQPQAQPLNGQQAADALRDMAQLLLKDSSLFAKDTQLLQNFVNGRQELLSQQDAKQLNLLLRMVQANIPAAVQQAGQQQGMEGLPKLWAFLQLAELGTLRDIKARDLKNANKEIKTLVSSMKGAITSEGSFRTDGQKSISFVMPLYIGENEQSYPAYINIYDEPPHEDEAGRVRKDTWFRVCVLTDNIGAVDIVCQLFEGNNLNLRVSFSSQDAVQAFSEYLPEVRRALYDTSIHLNDLKVGTVN